ncbi:MAG: hypothetical protein HYV09_03385 [Deltaproteobacteria bacterium]|nr:hypothetical protein [Deltaproteobacteria bacterium]
MLWKLYELAEEDPELAALLAAPPRWQLAMSALILALCVTAIAAWVVRPSEWD